MRVGIAISDELTASTKRISSFIYARKPKMLKLAVQAIRPRTMTTNSVEGCQAELTDSVGHGSERPHRSELHKNIGYAEYDGGEGFDDVDDGLGAPSNTWEREAKEQRHENHFENVSLREGVNHGGRDDVNQKIRDALRLSLSRIVGHGSSIQRSDIHVEASAGLHHVGHEQSDDESDGWDHFEI
jgi:hypothetical protein